MCCQSTNKQSNCCHGSNLHPALWSRKKKIEMLEHHLERLESKREDVKEALKELKDEANK